MVDRAPWSRATGDELLGQVQPVVTGHGGIDALSVGKSRSLERLPDLMLSESELLNAVDKNLNH